MLDIINRYAHGFVAMPVILVCQQRGLFKQIQQEPLSLEQLAHELSANKGHLQVALRLLESLGWLKRDVDGCYYLGEKAGSTKPLPSTLPYLIEFPMADYLNGRSRAPLLQLIEEIRTQWACADPILSDFLDGLWVLPLWLTLKQLDCLPAQSDAVVFEHISESAREELMTLFVQHDWIESGDHPNVVPLTESGQFLSQEIEITAALAAYAPMLKRLPDLLFGDAQQVFARDDRGHETHIDRRLNVRGSASQRQKYFSDLNTTLRTIFDTEDYADQPKVIAEMGCGDGKLLKHVYEFIQSHTKRGQVFEQYPLKLIGVDYNFRALKETAATLSDLPHQCIQGHIGDPQRLIDDLIEQGMEPDDVLHIRSFLDHERPYSPATTQRPGRPSSPYSGVYVDDAGQCIDPAMMIDSLVEHLTRWGRIINRHGLILLEAHCLEPHIVAKHLDSSESLHFDAYHGFSKQHLVEADVFLMSAAEAGLFPKADQLKFYPKALPFNCITLNHLEPRPYTIRHPELDDLEALMALEQAGWFASKQASAEELQTRLKTNPSGHCVIEQNGQILGAVYSQRIASVEALNETNYADMIELHCADGPILQVMNLTIHPEQQHLGLDDELLMFMLCRARLLNGVERVIGVTRCGDYPKHSDQSLEDYILQTDEEGWPLDANLRFHQYHGAQIQGLIPNFCPEDQDNEGQGVLIHYDDQGDDDQPSLETDTAQVAETALKEDTQTMNEVEQVIAPAEPGSYLIVLSAKTEEELQEVAWNFNEYLTQLPDTEADSQLLSEIAYTLQVDHDAMEERLGFIVRDRKTLQAKLEAFLIGEDDAQRFVGQVKRDKDALAVSTDGKDLEQAITAWIDEDNYSELLDLWVKGLTFDWDKLYGVDKPRRVSVPTYPLAEEDCSLSDEPSEVVGDSNGQHAMLHPLLHENTSTLSQKRFSSTFSGDEFFLNDHQVQGQKVLPGVAYLEMVREALAQASQADVDDSRNVVELSNVVWSRPLVVGEAAQEVNVSLSFEENGMVAFEVYTEDDASQALVHSQGQVNFAPAVAIPSLDLDDLQSGLEQQSSSVETYALFESMGFEYGPGHRGLESLYVGPGEVLAKVSLPTNVANTIDAYTLHPSLLDSALQASIGFSETSDSTPMLPFALARLECFAPCPPNLWAWLRESADSSEQMHKMDIDLCDESGQLCVRLHGFSSRRLPPSKALDSLLLPVQAQDEQDVLAEHIDEQQPPVDDTPEIDTQAQVNRASTPAVINNGTTVSEQLHHSQPLTESTPASHNEVRSDALDIAIIGLSGRYPQAENLKEFWSNLLEGKDCITEVPGERWDWREHYSEDRTEEGRHSSKWGGFIDDVDKFDPLFFNISPDEAESIDPQERLFLEHVWQALEDAGYTRADLHRPREDDLSAQVGVYAGVMYSEYQRFGDQAGAGLAPASSFASIANRVSYCLDLHGPSMTVDAMCSSALTSIHLACQDLKLGRTDMGIAGGVNINIHPSKYQMLSQKQFISSRGRCESFGEGGDGYIPGEGVGVVLLKRLADAERDNDRIYGVIKGSAVNHGGKTNGYTVPNPQAQSSVIHQAIKEARIDPRAISYVEANGTGNQLDDSTEIVGLSKAFGHDNQAGQYCAIGSVKSNIGHCESAAGVAGLTKVLLQMQHKKLVPSLHSKSLNPHIEFEDTPFAVNQALKDWQPPTIDGKSYPRVAGISSFGTGGSNAHIVVEEYAGANQERSTQPLAGPYMIVLSAKTAEQLRVMVSNLNEYLTQDVDSTIPLCDIAYTLQVGREAMEERLALLVEDRKTLQDKLTAFLAGKEDADVYQGQVKQNKDAINIFIENEEMQEALAKWVERGKYDNLLELWVKGLTLDWRKFYGENKPRRISLPTYPFAKERYWQHCTRSALAMRSDALDIAIIGVSGRYPQAENVQKFWANLRDGKDCITEVPSERWDWREHNHEESTEEDHQSSKWGGFIDDVDKFDPLFFNISPSEAELIDPQERLFLEHTWQALEDAGYTCADLYRPSEGGLPGQVGVYVGVTHSEYQLLKGLANPGLISNSIHGSIANRVSYCLNLHGPSMAVDTLCSSGLTSIHLACQDLKYGRTNMGIAGGVNISIHPSKHNMLSQGQCIFSRGHGERSGEGGDGYIPGEGVGVVLLKRLADAERDNDRIYGVIKGSAVNHGGNTNDYSVPNPQVQSSAIYQAIQEAHIDPRAISYIEAHGTGTKLGDSIEIAGLSKVLGHDKKEGQYCAIGSVKSNIGHCESAAGVAGLTKALLQMQHKQIVPSLHSKSLNPDIEFQDTPFAVNQTLKDWQPPTIDGKSYPRIASVSSLGAGGSNAHIILEEYAGASEAASTESLAGPHIIVLSARTEEQLRAVVHNLNEYLTEDTESTIPLSDIAYTLQVGREAMDERLGLVVENREDLQAKLTAFLAGTENVDIYRGQVKQNSDTVSIFTLDEELQEAMTKWVERGKYANLLELWVKGLSFDWNRLYSESKPKRISLPTYPFARERYWVEKVEKNASQD